MNQVGLICMLNTCPTAIDFDVYQPRNPKASAYYRCVEDHFEPLEAFWPHNESAGVIPVKVKQKFVGM